MARNEEKVPTWIQKEYNGSLYQVMEEINENEKGMENGRIVRNNEK